jgi:transposase
MPDPHPLELRERVVACYEAGEGSYRVVAERFALGEATVKRWVWLKQRQGSVAPRPKGGGTPSSVSPDELERLIDELRDPTANELTAAYNRSRRGRDRIHVSSMKRALHRCGYVVKKNADGRWRVFVPTLSLRAPHS